MRVLSTDPAHPAHSDHLISTGGRKPKRVELEDIHPHHLSNDCRQEMMMACQSSPIEVCGFVTAKHELHYVANAHENPELNFYMDETEGAEILNKIYASGICIIGVFHTHPNNIPWPSPRDIVGWPDLRLKWRYWIATRSDVLEWTLE